MATAAIDISDKTYVGSPHPKYYGGFSNEFTYGSFALRGFFTFSQGNKIFNMMRIFTDDGACTWDNKTTNVMARWQKPGDITERPAHELRLRLGRGRRSRAASSRMARTFASASSRSRTRCRRAWRIARISHPRACYVSGHNLKLWTKYMGYDPDVNSAGSDENVIMGTDYYAYPQPRTITFGINAGW